MRVMHHDLTVTLFCIAAILTLGCDGSTEPTPLTGAIQVTVATAGPSAEVDPDGYTLRINGGPGQEVGVNARLTISSLPWGNHILQLDGIAPNCSVMGANPRAVDVIAGRAAWPVDVYFDVSCRGKDQGDSGAGWWDY